MHSMTQKIYNSLCQAM